MEIRLEEIRVARRGPEETVPITQAAGGGGSDKEVIRGGDKGSETSSTWWRMIAVCCEDPGATHGHLRDVEAVLQNKGPEEAPAGEEHASRA